MKVGDKVKVIDEKSTRFGQVGKIEYIRKKSAIYVDFGEFVHVFDESEIELFVEPKVYHLDLSLEDMNALAELGKMKDNLELLERLLKRAKGETND